MNELDRLIQLLSKLPGLGPRSARRAALHLIQKRTSLMAPLATSLDKVLETIQTCSICGNLDAQDPCGICRNESRDDSIICIVEQVSDLWALERTKVFNGRYHILGGVLSPLDGVGPEDLSLAKLMARLEKDPRITEVILATNLTLNGQITAHYISEMLENQGVTLSRLAHGVPAGGELDYLDDGTLRAALSARHKLEN